LNLGMAADYGICKGIRKSDGQPCHGVVNVRHSEYCDFHTAAALKKLKSSRPEFINKYDVVAYGLVTHLILVLLYRRRKQNRPQIHMGPILLPVA